MELQGKVIAVLPERSGVSARGEWKAQSLCYRNSRSISKEACALMFSEQTVWLSSTFRVVRRLLVSFDIGCSRVSGSLVQQRPRMECAACRS